MARNALVSQAPSAAGITPTYAAVDNINGMSFVNTGRTILHIKASGALAITFRMPGTADGVAFVGGGKVYTFAGAGEVMVSLRNASIYAQADGTTYVDFSTAAGTIAVFDGGAA